MSFIGSDPLAFSHITAIQTLQTGETYIPMFSGKHSTLSGRAHRLVTDPAIDIAVTFVDNTVPGFVEACKAHTGSCPPCQYRTLGELKYTLRSIAKNAPWARVWLVVQDKRHVPSWINTATVNVVEHEAFIPKDILPTFHYGTILSHLHLFEGLHEKFIVWADDTILTRPLDHRAMFDAKGAPLTGFGIHPIFPDPRSRNWYSRVQAQSARAWWRATGKRAICVEYPHMPIAIEKSVWRRFEEEMKACEEYQASRVLRGRTEDGDFIRIDPKTMFANWVEMNVRKRGNLVRLWKVLRQASPKAARRILGFGCFGHPLCGKYAVVNNPKRMARNMERLLHVRATFANINDDAYGDWGWPGSELQVNPVCQDMMDEALTKLFPSLSRFESASPDVLQDKP